MEIVFTSQVIPASGTILQTKTGGRSAYEIENLKMFEPTKLRTTSHQWAFLPLFSNPSDPWAARAEDRELKAPGEPLHKELGDFIGDIPCTLDF